MNSLQIAKMLVLRWYNEVDEEMHKEPKVQQP